MMNSKTWASLVTLVFFVLQHQSGVRPADAFAPSSIKHTRSSSSSSSSTALDMTKTSPQQQQKKQLEVTAVASLFALTVATSNPLPLLSAAAADQIIAKPTPQVTVTPFGGGFGGIGLSPFGLNPFGGLGAGFGIRITPRPQPLPPEQQLEAMKEYRAQMDARIKMMEQQQRAVEQAQKTQQQNT